MAIASVVGKLMVLILVAVFPDLSTDTRTFIGPDDSKGCQTFGLEQANKWKDEQKDIVAIQPNCFEIINPAEEYQKFKEDHKELFKHNPGKDEA